MKIIENRIQEKIDGVIFTPECKISDFIALLERIRTMYGDLPVWWTDGEFQEIPIDKECVKVESYHNKQYPLRVKIG